MELYFIRHGQSENNANWEEEGFQDVPDPELTEIGQKQAAHLAKYLSENQGRDETIPGNNQNQFGFGLTNLYTSLMVRAVATATPAAQAIGLPLMTWPDIHESGGIFSRTDGDERPGLPGKNRFDFESRFPDLVLPDWLDENGWWKCRPFEERPDRKVRATLVWEELLARHGDQPGRPEHRVGFVSHGGFFMQLLTCAIQVEMRRMDDWLHEYWFLMNNCAITRIDVRDQVLVCYTNRSEFLPAELIT